MRITVGLRVVSLLVLASACGTTTTISGFERRVPTTEVTTIEAAAASTGPGSVALLPWLSELALYVEAPPSLAALPVKLEAVARESDLPLPSEGRRLLSEAGLTGRWAAALRDWERTGVLDVPTVKAVGAALGARTLIQPLTVVPSAAHVTPTFCFLVLDATAGALLRVVRIVGRDEVVGERVVEVSYVRGAVLGAIAGAATIAAGVAVAAGGSEDGFIPGAIALAAGVGFGIGALVNAVDDRFEPAGAPIPAETLLSTTLRVALAVAARGPEGPRGGVRCEPRASSADAVRLEHCALPGSP